MRAEQFIQRVQVLQKMRESTTEEYPGGDSILKLG